MDLEIKTSFPPKHQPELLFLHLFCYLLNGSHCVCRPRPDHYFPDLHHLKFEIEEGTTLDGRPVRFGYNPLEFKDFSWRGYAQMSPIQVGTCHH